MEGRERRFYSWHVGVNAVLCVVCGTVYIAIHNYVGVSVIRPRVCVDGSMGSCFVGKRREGEEGERRGEGRGGGRGEGRGGGRGEGGRRGKGGRTWRKEGGGSSLGRVLLF